MVIFHSYVDITRWYVWVNVVAKEEKLLIYLFIDSVSRTNASGINPFCRG